MPWLLPLPKITAGGVVGRSGQRRVALWFVVNHQAKTLDLPVSDLQGNHRDQVRLDELNVPRPTLRGASQLLEPVRWYTPRPILGTCLRFSRWCHTKALSDHDAHGRRRNPSA
jgi:hypothetical protein